MCVSTGLKHLSSAAEGFWILHFDIWRFTDVEFYFVLGIDESLLWCKRRSTNEYL